jgi:hypothetical protein
MRTECTYIRTLCAKQSMHVMRMTKLIPKTISGAISGDCTIGSSSCMARKVNEMTFRQEIATQCVEHWGRADKPSHLLTKEWAHDLVCFELRVPNSGVHKRTRIKRQYVSFQQAVSTYKEHIYI